MRRLHNDVTPTPLANAGHGFLDQNFEEVRHVIDTNITGTLSLIQNVGREMRARSLGRILISGSVAGFMPGTFQAVYGGTKAFLNAFSFALRNELQNTGVTVTCLMPDVTETEFFERAGMLDTAVGQQEKDDPVDVAKAGFDAMLQGEGDVVTSWKNKRQTPMAHMTPASLLAEPGSGKQWSDGREFKKKRHANGGVCVVSSAGLPNVPTQTGQLALLSRQGMITGREE